MSNHMRNTTLKHVKIVLTYESGEERNVEVPLTRGSLDVYFLANPDVPQRCQCHSPKMIDIRISGLLDPSGTLAVYDSEPYVIEKGPDLTKSILKELGLKTPRKARPRRSPARRPPRR